MTTHLRGAWQGWSGKTVVELTDGTIWQQAEYHYEYRYAYRPVASVARNLMTVEGMSRPVRVRRVPSARLNVVSDWKGWDGKTEVELSDGSHWQQVEYLYEYRYAHRPWAILIDNTLQVEGMSRPVRVRRIK
jgi:hypothetical protein